VRRTLLALALAAVTLAVFWRVTANDFVNYDDDRYLTENPFVQRGLDATSLRWAWTTGYMANWHPLTWMSHMLDAQLFGTAPAGHHATNVVLHALDAALVFVLLDVATGAAWRSALAAALFALHPTHVESVAWASERKDVLSTALWLLTTLAYVAWVRRPGRGRYALVGLALALGLTAKAMLVTLPATLLLLDYWPLGRLRSTRDLWPRMREKLPLVPIVVASAVVTLAVQGSGGAVGSLDAYPLAVRIGNAVDAYATYLWMAVWPFDLAIIYPHPGQVSGWRVAASATVLAVLSAVALRERGRRPYLLVGWLWYLGTLVPVIGLVQVGDAALADRYTYVPFLGLFVAVAWALPAWPRVVPALAGVVLALLAARTRGQIGFWRDSVTLFSHAIAVDERNPVAHNNLAFALADRGEVVSALEHLRRALVLRPAYLTARVKLGNLLLAQGQVDEAAAQYDAAVSIDRTSVAALTNLGRVRAEQGRVDEAIALQKQALAIDPASVTAELNLGMALARKGQIAEARGHFEHVLEADPDNAEAHNNLGNMLLAEGRNAEALAAIDRALALRPHFGLAHSNRAAALLLLGRFGEAWTEIRRARADGYEPPRALIHMLAEQMPEPPGDTEDRR
jgi:tetratricopeptide (TPR) repeat protein